MKRIILKTSHTPSLISCQQVKLTPEAVLAIQRIQLRSGLTARQIVSDIIVQAENMVSIVETAADEEGGEDDE